MINQATKRRKGQRGFTLIELLLVVAILAVLAFLAVPAIASTIRNARMRTCASNEQMIEQGIWRWYADQLAAGRTLLDTASNITTDGDFAAVEDLIPGSDALIGYFTPGGIPECPFTSNEDYEIFVSIYAEGFLDVLVICEDAETVPDADDGHPRSQTPRQLKTVAD